MDIREIHDKILVLRRELDEMIQSTGDLCDPRVLAISRELDELVLLLQRLEGRDPGVHSMTSSDYMLSGQS